MLQKKLLWEVMMILDGKLFGILNGLFRGKSSFVMFDFICFYFIYPNFLKREMDGKIWKLIKEFKIVIYIFKSNYFM
jgi:hypothetical protein